MPIDGRDLALYALLILGIALRPRRFGEPEPRGSR